MTQGAKKKECRENGCCSMSKISPGGSQMGNFITFIRSFRGQKLHQFPPEKA